MAEFVGDFCCFVPLWLLQTNVIACPTSSASEIHWGYALLQEKNQKPPTKIPVSYLMQSSNHTIINSKFLNFFPKYYVKSESSI